MEELRAHADHLPEGEATERSRWASETVWISCGDDEFLAKQISVAACKAILDI